ncbi:MAG TPA: hypothetical protein VJ836_06615 [Candidatus Saccharimonadales bacterium]|nr:hypothetical protein [Candidatus Saccharimonadales bacterium]
MSKILHIEQQGIIKNGLDISEGDVVIGTLSSTGMIHPKAKAEMNGRQWMFEKKGFFRNKIFIKSLDSDEVIATYHPEMLRTRGSLYLTKDNKEYRYKSTNMWKSHYAWTDNNGKDLISYKIGGFLKVRGKAEVADLALEDPHYSLILMLGAYLSHNDASDATGAAAASGGS